MSGKLHIDPEIRDAVYPLRDEEKAGLENSILKHGKMSPIVVWKETNTIIDGHHSYEVCLKHGKGFVVKSMSFSDKAAVILFVKQLALNQRNLTDFQRGELALSIQGPIQIAAAERVLAGRTDHPRVNLPQGKTCEIIGENVHLSGSTIQKIETIKENATPKLVEMVREGKISIDAAHKVSTLPKSEQRETVKEGPEAVKEAAAEIRKAPKKINGEIKDTKGNVITIKSVADVFARRGEMTALMTQISKLKMDVLRKCDEDPLFVRINKSSFQMACENVHRDLRFAMPICQCPVCGGDGGLNKTCRQCKATGWLNEHSFNSLPKAMREKEEAAK